MSYKKIDKISRETVENALKKEKRLGSAAIELGVSLKTLHKLILKFDLKIEKMPSPHEIDMSNKKCGFLEVKEKHDKDSHGRTRWKCLCVCGKIKIATGKYLRNGSVISCGCRDKGYDGIIPGYWYSGTKARASQIRDWEVSYKDLCDLFEKQNKRCALTGRKLEFSKTKKEYCKNRTTTASLDRIDSSKGYIKTNIQWVHKNVNKIKNDLSQQEFINICKEVTEWRMTCKS
jgi:hypothetical protein